MPEQLCQQNTSSSLWANSKQLGSHPTANAAEHASPSLQHDMNKTTQHASRLFPPACCPFNHPAHHPLPHFSYSSATPVSTHLVQCHDLAADAGGELRHLSASSSSDVARLCLRCMAKAGAIPRLQVIHVRHLHHRVAYRTQPAAAQHSYFDMGL
jgi:hypothetical protein